jgi:hypothetical protein
LLAFHDALRGASWRPYICGLKVLTPTTVRDPDVLVAAGRRDPTVVVEVPSSPSEDLRSDLQMA